MDEITQHLITGCLQQNRQTQLGLYDRYAGLLYNVCVRITANSNDAEEAMHDSFLKIFSRLDQFRDEACIGLFLVLLPPNNDESVSLPTESACHLERKELLLYYTMQTNDKLRKLETLTEKNTAPGEDNLAAEIRRIILENHRFEKEILPSLPCTSEGTLTITQQYKTSLKSIDFMLGKMERIANRH